MINEYTPKVWQDNDPITDVDLNKIENRITEIQCPILGLKKKQSSNKEYIELTYNQAKFFIDNKIFPVVQFKVEENIIALDYLTSYVYIEGKYYVLSGFVPNNEDSLGDSFCANSENEFLSLSFGL